MSIGHIIAKYRKQKGLKQWELADLVGVSQSYVARWETDRVNPRMGTLEKVAEALEIPVEQLLLDDKGVIAGMAVDDAELAGLLQQLPKLNSRELDALKVFLDSLLTRHHMEEMLRRS
ncbi:MAG: helix-turn-helix transcriptional regulator [Vulcanimicrobiota bacterium]